MSDIINNNFDLDELLTALKVTSDELQGSVRTQRLADARAMFVARIIQQPNIRQHDIALYLNTSQPAVSKMLKRHEDLLIYNDYRSTWQNIKNINIIKTERL